MKYEKGQTVVCVNNKLLGDNTVAPDLEVGKNYPVNDIVLDSQGNQHLDVGLKSQLNYVRSLETGENLPHGDTVHWCHPSRFELADLYPLPKLDMYERRSLYGSDASARKQLYLNLAARYDNRKTTSYACIELLREAGWLYSKSRSRRVFPEFYAQKPNHDGSSWFYADPCSSAFYTERAAALRKAAELCDNSWFQALGTKKLRLLPWMAKMLSE